METLRLCLEARPQISDDNIPGESWDDIYYHEMF